MGRLIDIDRLCDDLTKRWSIADKKKEDLIRAVMADVVTPIVVSQPTVDAVPVRRGRWETDGIMLDECEYLMTRCTACGGTYEYGFNMPFCPNCGADMRKDGKHGKDD